MFCECSNNDFGYCVPFMPHNDANHAHSIIHLVGVTDIGPKTTMTTICGAMVMVRLWWGPIVVVSVIARYACDRSAICIQPHRCETSYSFVCFAMCFSLYLSLWSVRSRA